MRLLWRPLSIRAEEAQDKEHNILSIFIYFSFIQLDFFLLFFIRVAPFCDWLFYLHFTLPYFTYFWQIRFTQLRRWVWIFFQLFYFFFSVYFLTYPLLTNNYSTLCASQGEKYFASFNLFSEKKKNQRLLLEDRDKVDINIQS